MNLKKHLLITLAVIILFIVAFMVIIGLWLFSTSHTQPLNNNTPTPIQTTSGITYQPNSTNKFMNMFQNSKNISTKDSQVKAQLLQAVEGNSGIVQQAESYTLYYRSISKLFDTEITTTDVNQGKKDAESWLFSQGLSQDGICKLPIEFYPSIQVKQQIQQENKSIEFNPNPDGC